MLFSVIIVAAIVALDQLTKYLATAYLMPVGAMPFIPGIMELRYLLNDGMAFSLLSGGRWLLIGVTSVTMVGMAFYAWRYKAEMSKLEYFSLLMIIGGGIGNLIDRIATGYVVDFFATTFIDFAVFNVADCFVTVGVFLLAAAILYSEFIAKSKAPAQKQGENCEAADE